MNLRALLAAAALVSAAPAPAADDPSAPMPLRIVVGSTLDLCATGTIACPAGGARCDDLAVVRPEAGEAGLVLRGLKPGVTLCSAAGASGAGARRVYRVTVVP